MKQETTVAGLYTQRLHEQSVKHEAEVKEVMLVSGLAGTAVGVVIGFVLALLVRRRKIAALLLAAVVGAGTGCSTCSDGQKSNPLGGGLLTRSSSYSACNRGCVTKGKRCDCSKQCPCWDEHRKNP